MQHIHIPLQRPLAVSLCIHVLVFGTALAFAQYTGALFRNEGAAVTVSLVSGGGGAATRHGLKTARRMPVSTMTPALPEPAAALAPAAETNIGEVVPQAAGSEGVGTETDRQGLGTGTAITNAEDGAGAFSLEQWRQLHSAIEQVKTYPRLARERGIEGTVLVRFRVQPSGMVETVRVVKSSGAAILDEASVRTIYQAGPMPYVNGWIEVPMSYMLK